MTTTRSQKKKKKKKGNEKKIEKELKKKGEGLISFSVAAKVMTGITGRYQTHPVIPATSEIFWFLVSGFLFLVSVHQLFLLALLCFALLGGWFGRNCTAVGQPGKGHVLPFRPELLMLDTVCVHRLSCVKQPAGAKALLANVIQ